MESRGIQARMVLFITLVFSFITESGVHKVISKAKAVNLLCDVTYAMFSDYNRDLFSYA